MQTHHDIAGVAVGIVGVALLIAVLMPTTGVLTSAVSGALHAVFGVGALIVPVGLVLWGVTFFVHTDRILPGRAAVGLGLVALAVISLLGITTPGAVDTPSVLFNTYVLADRGGYVGNGMAWALLSMTGQPIGIVVLVGLILAGLIVIGFSVTQTVQDIVLHVRERRAWARLQSQERAAQRVRDQQQAWFDRAGAQVPADYAPTALFDPNRPLSGPVDAAGMPGAAARAASGSVIRAGVGNAAPTGRVAHSFGCGDAPLGGAAPESDVPDASEQVAAFGGARTRVLGSKAGEGFGFDAGVAPAVPGFAGIPNAVGAPDSGRAAHTTFLQSDEVREAYDYLSGEGQGLDPQDAAQFTPDAGTRNSTSDRATAAPGGRAPAGVAERMRERRSATLSRDWWDDGRAGSEQEDADDIDGLLSGEEREAQLADGPVPVPGVIAGAPRTLADFGLDESDFAPQDSAARGAHAFEEPDAAAGMAGEGEPPAVIPAGPARTTTLASAPNSGTSADPDVRPGPGRAARVAARVSTLTSDTLAKNVASQQARASQRAAAGRPGFTDVPEEGLPWEDAPVASTGGAAAAPSAPTPREPFELPDPGVLKRTKHGLHKTKEEEAEVARTGARLQQTLTEFGVKAQVADWVFGPTCTTYEVSPGEGVRVSKFTSLEDDIARSLATESVRIYAPVPGTSYVGIEVPNAKRQVVCFGDVLPYVDGGPLDFAVGLNANGQPVHVDLAKLPHLLVAGTTGSGKSVMVNSIVMSFLMRATPDDVRLIMVDPKQVEFKDYDGIPHLIMPVVTDMRQAAAALQWGVTEMDRRYRVFSNLGVRDLKGYNDKVASGAFDNQEFPLKHLPSVVVVVDELADLMMVAKKDVEASIVRIAQLGRAAGIHLVLATQSPRADVVTGLIRANVACRVGLKVGKGTESQIAIDQRGAEKLLGHGDMLFLQTAWGDKPRRIQGCYLTDPEISAVVEYLKGQAAPDYDTGMAPLGTATGQLTMNLDGSGDAGAGQSGETELNDDDPLAWQAAQLVVENQLGSTSMIQRRLKLGYARAGRVMDMLEEMGVVGPARGSKPRDVLVRDLDELATIRGTHQFEEEF